MSKESLPLYQIPDFETALRKSSAFYYSRLSTHLSTHQFIQKPHKHDFYIILLFTRGEGSHWIDFQKYPVEKGSIFFLSPGQVHHWSLSEDCEGHVIFFNAEFYSLGFPGKTLTGFPFFGLTHLPPYLQLDTDPSVDLEKNFVEIESEETKTDWSKNEYLRSLTEILLIKLGRIYRLTYRISSEENKSTDRKILLEAAIEANFRTNHQASFYSDILNLSLKQLNRLSKSNFGKPISQLLLDRIILESQRLLTYSEDSIAEIASRVGFDDPSYFSRLFRKKAGFTPEQFRKLIR